MKRKNKIEKKKGNIEFTIFNSDIRALLLFICPAILELWYSVTTY